MEFKKVLFTAIVAGLLAGCGTTERFVKVSEDVVPKTVDIHVLGVAKELVLTIKDGNFEIEEATVPVHVEGAGVFVSPNNHVLTCAHLFWLDKITSISVCTQDGTCTAAELLHKEDGLDLGLLQTYFDAPTPYARIADPRKLKVGQEVLAIGSPLGLPFSVSHGIISALNRDDIGYNMTQSDAFLNPGNSGGPLFNLNHEIVGINSRILPPVRANIFTGLGFSVQSGQIIEFLTRVRNKYERLGEGFPRLNKGYWEGFLSAIGYRK